ncbi:Transcription factor Adf-1 [Gryllus bimaculatus]|nr:Transcription factor Adf-1 [Gryllus bimaculatus]
MSASSGFSARKREDDFNVKFIKCVEKYPCLYDSNHSEYYMKNKVNETWLKIANEVGDSERNCRARWQNIRTAFGRCVRGMDEQRKLGTSNSRSPYYLADLLHFLLPHLHKRKRGLNERNMDMLFVEGTYEEVPSEADPVGYQNLPVKLEESNECFPVGEFQSNGFEETGTQTNTKCVCGCECRWSERDRIEGDSDRCFLLGVLPDLQTLSPKYKRLFRKEMTKLLDELHDKQSNDQ